MNRKRRNEIKKLIDAIRAQHDLLREISSELDSLKDRIECLKDEEQDSHSAMPESIQNGDKGAAAQESIDALQTAQDTLDEILVPLDADVIDRIDDIVDSLESASA